MSTFSSFPKSSLNESFNDLKAYSNDKSSSVDVGVDVASAEVKADVASAEVKADVASAEVKADVASADEASID